MINNKKFKAFRAIPIILIFIIISATFAGCGNSNSDIIENPYQLNNSKYTISVDAGSAAANSAIETFPNAKITYNNSISDAYLAVEQGKSDAFVYGKLYLQYAISSEALDDLAIMNDTLDTADIAVGLSPKNTELLTEVNAFIKEIKADGTFDDMYQRWVINADDTMPNIEEPKSPTRTLKFGTSGLVVPMNYIDENQEVTGFDVEFMKRLALYLNADVEIETMSFDALVASLESEKLDLVVSDLNVTDERKKVILMSDPYMKSETGILVKKDRLNADETSINSVDELDGKTIGLVAGSSYDNDIAELFPNSQITALASYADLISAMQNGRIDAYISDAPLAEYQVSQTPGIKYFDDMLTTDKYAFAMNIDNTELQSKINTALAELKSEGKFDELSDKWISADGSHDLTKIDKSKATNGVLKVVTSCDAEPFTYKSGDNVVGYDIDMMNLVADKLGYTVEYSVSDFNALIPSVTSSKADVAIGCISVTPERAKAVLFSEPDYYSGTVAMVLDNTAEKETFLTKMKGSFERTFITDNRWKLILHGLLTTIELSVISALLGTILGFLFSFPLRSKNKAVRGAAKTVSTILNGMPIVVILMLLYYIIFSKSALPAVWIGIFGFTLDFANAVAGLLNTGVTAVDSGQLEAASSMGYKKWQIFMKITLPQAAKQMFPQYNGAIVSLIKGTAVIGYITVEDLTKASDIIRSRTYEAFFPLIVTAVIYFVLARIIVALLQRINIKLDPKGRKRKIKGVEEHD